MRCLVIQTAFLGDVILTVPLLRTLRDDPRVRWVGVLASPPGSELLEGQDLVDEVINYDKRDSDRSLPAMSDLISRLRASHPGVALVPHRSFRSAFLAFAAGVPLRVGFDESGGRLLLNRTVPYRARGHEIERVASLAAAIGLALPEGRLPFTLKPPDGTEEAISEVLSGRGVGAEAGLVVVAPGSRWPTKRWPEERFATAADQLAEQLGAEIVLMGSSDDVEVCGRVRSAMRERATDLSGVISLGETIALAGRARLVLSNDSAAAHIAAGAGTPVVAVFGPTVPSQGFAPYSDASRVVQVDLACRPCGRHGGVRCRRGDHACMKSVEVGDVVAAARELLWAGEDLP